MCERERKKKEKEESLGEKVNILVYPVSGLSWKSHDGVLKIISKL